MYTKISSHSRWFGIKMGLNIVTSKQEARAQWNDNFKMLIYVKNFFPGLFLCSTKLDIKSQRKGRHVETKILPVTQDSF